MRLFSFLMLMLWSGFATGQEREMYTPDFTFKDGIYLSFDDFKNDNPVPLTHILSDFDIRAANYLDLVLKADSVIYYDNHFEERAAATISVWGYAKGGKPFIGHDEIENSDDWQNRGWFPLLFVGSYSYFSALGTVIRSMGPAPGGGMNGYGGLGHGGFGNGGFYSDRTYEETVSVQLLLDFKSGKNIQLATGDLKSISPELMKQLLGRDGELLNQYEAQPFREQKQSSMFFVRRFNERNPIYFPFYESED
ncbi:MAG: hypothetical protein JKX84_06445 [Flavobacteriales bacterium]|nr:hypothetical protein [Flavobacteriales bacterium]